MLRHQRANSLLAHTYAARNRLLAQLEIDCAGTSSVAPAHLLDSLCLSLNAQQGIRFSGGADSVVIPPTIF